MVPGGKENVWCVVPCCVVPCHVVLGHVVLGRGAGLVCKPPSPQSDVVPLVVPCCFFFRARESCLTFSWCPPCGCSLVHLVPSLWLIWCGPIGGRWSRWSPPLTRYPMRPGGLVATGPDPESVSRPRSRSRSRPRSYPDAGPGPGPDPDPAARSCGTPPRQGTSLLGTAARRGGRRASEAAWYAALAAARTDGGRRAWPLPPPVTGGHSVGPCHGAITWGHSVGPCHGAAR